MPRSRSLRSILLLVVSLAGASCAGAGDLAPAPPPVPLDEALRRTVAAGSARLHADLRGDDGTVTVTGVTSFRGPASTIVATMPGAPPAEVRVTARGTWLRHRPDAAWIALDPRTVDLVGATNSWGDLLAGLRPVGAPRPGHLRATHDGDPALVDLDRDGRIRRLRIDRPGARLDLRLSDLGTPVEVDDP